MATVIADYGDRLDIIAYREYGAVTDAGMSALVRANPFLPFALRGGESVQVPEAPAPLDYGSEFEGWDYGTLAEIIESHPQPRGDFDSRDFDPRDFLTEL